MAEEGAYRADAQQVHMATLRDDLWSPACSTERGWAAPLADPNYPGQMTCSLCRRIALTGRGDGAPDA